MLAFYFSSLETLETRRWDFVQEAFFPRRKTRLLDQPQDALRLGWLSMVLLGRMKRY